MVCIGWLLLQGLANDLWLEGALCDFLELLKLPDVF